MPRHYIPDAQQALGFVQSQTAYIEQQVYETQYPEIQYSQLIPVDTSADAWAKSIVYYSTDKVGQAGWFHHLAKDLHYADINRTKNEVGVEMADIGYRWSIEEIGVAMRLGENLAADRAAAANRAYEEFVDEVALRGNAAKNMSGIINYPGITAVLAAIVGGHTTWDQKTADQILADINTILSGAYIDTLQVEIADTILLPVAAWTRLSTLRIGDTNMTALAFLQMNNVYTATTGRPLTIRAVRGLETAGQGGSGRMVAYRRDPAVLKMHIPMPHQFMPVWHSAPLVFDVPGIFRIAGLEIRRPKAVRYMDGIWTEDQLS